MLPDLLGPGLRLVVCGSAVGPASNARRAYYAGPGNRFWQTLAEVHLTPIRLTPPDFPRLLDFGIGLTDVVKNQAGTDTAIRFEQVDRARLTKALEEWQPRYLCFNGKRAAQEYFRSKAIAYSAAARASWDLGPWQELAALVAA